MKEIKVKEKNIIFCWEEFIFFYNNSDYNSGNYANIINNKTFNQRNSIILEIKSLMFFNLIKINFSV